MNDRAEQGEDEDGLPDPGQDGKSVLGYMALQGGEVTNVELETRFAAMFDTTVSRLISDGFISRDRTGYRFTERFRGLLKDQPNFLK